MEEIRKAYAPFVNYFEELKKLLRDCEEKDKRLHAFLKTCEAGIATRLKFDDIFIAPVQRLGSVELLLNDLIRRTDKRNPDYIELQRAHASLHIALQ